MLFLAGWLAMWCFGEAAAIRGLLAGGRIGRIFLLGWFVAWTVGGGVALYAWLWTTAGRATATAH